MVTCAVVFEMRDGTARKHRDRQSPISTVPGVGVAPSGLLFAAVNPHPRIRKTVKWSVLVIGVVLFVVGAASTWCGLGCFWWAPAGERHLWLSGGRVIYRTISEPAPTNLQYYQLNWDIETSPRVLIGSWWPQSSTTGPQRVQQFPLWIPCLSVFGAAAMLWRWDVIATRRAGGLCPACLYERTGLALRARCPECGKVM